MARAVESPAIRTPLWATLTATFLGIGRMRPGPGSWASAAAGLLWWVVWRWTPPDTHLLTSLLLVALAVGIGIPAASRVARASGTRDPGIVVIDEVAGQLITFLAVPLSWKSLLAGFILFRGFDILKPPPLRQLEQLPGGVGIVVDDVAAGLYALAIMHVLLHFGILPR